MNRPLFYACQVLLITGSIGWVFAQEKDSAEAALQGQIAGLIDELGSDQFAVREQASVDLMAIGEAALPQLRSAPKRSGTFELRQRVGVLCERIEKEKFDRLSQSFLLDSDKSQSYGLPGWKLYRELVGASRTSKLLFLDMIRQQPDIVELLDKTSDAQSANAEIRKLSTLASEKAALIREDLYSGGKPEIGDAMCMLVVASTLPTTTPVEISEVIVRNVRGGFGGNFHKQGYAACLKKLVANWLLKTHEPLAPVALEIALAYELPEGVEVARSHLTANFDNDTRRLAFRCLWRFGDRSDIDRLIPLLDDNSILESFSRPTDIYGLHESNAAPPGLGNNEASQVNENMIVRINDVALALILELSGEDPRLTFPLFEPSSNRQFFESLATSSREQDEQRRRIETWKDTLSKK